MKKMVCFLLLATSFLFAETLWTEKSQQNIEKIRKILSPIQKLSVEHVHKFHSKIRALASREKGALRFIASEGLEKKYALPFSAVKDILFAQNRTTGEWASYKEYTKAPAQFISFSEMTDEQFSKLVLAAYAQEPRDFAVLDGKNRWHRDVLIEEMRQNTEKGKKLIALEYRFLQNVSRAFWEFIAETETDEQGNFSIDSGFDCDNNYVRTVQLRWRGIHEAFTFSRFTINGQNTFEGRTMNYEEYEVHLDVGAKNNFTSVMGEGGPANTKIEVVLADCGCGKEQ